MSSAKPHAPRRSSSAGAGSRSRSTGDGAPPLAQTTSPLSAYTDSARSSMSVTSVMPRRYSAFASTLLPANANAPITTSADPGTRASAASARCRAAHASGAAGSTGSSSSKSPDAASPSACDSAEPPPSVCNSAEPPRWRVIAGTNPPMRNLPSGLNTI